MQFLHDTVWVDTGTVSLYSPGVSRMAKIGIALGGVFVCAIAAFFLMFPKLGAWVVRTRVLPRMEQRLDRQVSAREIKVGFGTLSMKSFQNGTSVK